MSANVITSLSRVLQEVEAERTAQDAKWGEQNHPDGTGPQGYHVHIVGVADRYRDACQAAAAAGRVTYRDILLEEVYEAMAEADPDKLRAELVQVAAVAVAWVEAIDRRERVYISGPIASDPDAREHFAQAAEAVRATGREVVNPFDVPPVDHEGTCPDVGYTPGSNPGNDAEGHTSSCCYMRTDLRALLDCDVIHLLPGWERSKGAGVERTVAEACGMRVEKHEP